MTSSMSPPFITILTFFVLVFLVANNPVLSQLLPCPVPGFEDAMETQEDCDCFYAFATVDLLDYDNIYAEDSYLYYPRSGMYTGPVGIQEYSDLALNSPYSTYYPPSNEDYLSSVAFKYATSTGEGQCELFVASRTQFQANPQYTENNQEACADMVSGSKITYSLTKDRIPRVSVVKTHDVWTPGLFVESFYSLSYNTRATAVYICDKIINTCRDYSIPSRRKRNTRRGRKLQKWTERRREMRKCVRKYNALPDMTYSADGTIGYADGDSKSCRFFHSHMASTNTDHCPHISFEREVDLNGKYKCSESALVRPDVAFTSDEIDFLMDAGVNVFGYPTDSPGGVLLFDICPIAKKDE